MKASKSQKSKRKQKKEKSKSKPKILLATACNKILKEELYPRVNNPGRIMGEIPELKGIGPVIAKHLQDVPNGKEFQHILFLFSKLFFNSRFMLNQLMNTKCDDHSQNEIRRRFSKMIYEALLAGIKEVETHETRYVPATNHE